MIGDLTFDKSSKDMNLFLYSIYLIGKYGTNNEIRRNFYTPCFIERMADFTGSNPYKIKDGKFIEERTLFNKSLYAQYYGFINRKKSSDNKEILFLTERGKIIFNCIECDEDNGVCKIKDSCHSILQDLIWTSIKFDSFGKNNDGAQTSHTDIDVPKTIFRTIFDLGYASNEEIFYVIFSLNKGDDGNLKINKSYDNILSEIIANRENNIYSYADFFIKNGLKNKVNDSKVIDILSDDKIGIIEKKENDGVIFNYLSNSCNRFLADKDIFECWNNPLNLILHTVDMSATKCWLKQSILNSEIDNDFISWIDLSSVENASALKALLLNSIKKANLFTDRNQYVILISRNEDELEAKMDAFVNLLKRIDKYESDKHGQSEKTIIDSNGIEIVFPSNFQFIAIIKE